MQQAGFEVMALEMRDELGGVWSATQYPLTTHAKSFSYRFHDFPPMTSAGSSATQAEVRDYLAAFARAKGIADNIRYGQRVERIIYRSDRSPRCAVIAGEERHECDVVVCATGFANSGKPNVPRFEGSSRVRVLHSSRVSPAIVDDIVGNHRQVVVLGAGKSAHEILWLLREQAARITWLYVKSLWSTSYEKLYSDPVREPWNAALYLYYMTLQAARRKLGWGRAMKALQVPLVRSGYLVNPLEQDTDICMNRGAILKADQLAFLKTLRSIKTGVARLGESSVVLDRGDEIDADYLICATGYDRSASLPAVSIERDGGTIDHALAAQHGFYQHMIDPEVPEISVLSAAILYPQHLLGFSLGAQWLARFHQGRLRPQPSTADMKRWLARRAVDFGPWCSGDYLSNGVPYAHQRDKDVLPHLFEQMGVPPGLARSLHLRGTDERAFADVCDRVARALA